MKDYSSIRYPHVYIAIYPHISTICNFQRWTLLKKENLLLKIALFFQSHFENMNQQTNMAQKHYIFASDNRATGKYFHMTIKNMILDWHVCVFFAWWCDFCVPNGIGLYSGIISGSHVLVKDGWRRRIKSSGNQRKFWAFGVGWLLKRRRSKDKTDLLDSEIPTFVPHWNSIMGAANGQRGSGIYPGKDSRP